MKVKIVNTYHIRVDYSFRIIYVNKDMIFRLYFTYEYSFSYFLIIEPKHLIITKKNLTFATLLDSNIYLGEILLAIKQE